MSCNRSSNNKFFNSPSRMADGRLLLTTDQTVK